MRTLLFERACLLTFCTLLVLTNVGEHRGVRGARWFATSNINYFIGGLLIAGRDHMPEWASVILANFLYSIGYVFLHRCLSEFFGRKVIYWRAQWAVAVLSLVQCIYFTSIHPGLHYRLAAIGLATGLQFALCAAVAWHGVRTRMRSSAIAMGCVLSLSALLNLARVPLTLGWDTSTVYLHAALIQTSIVMLNTVVFVAIDITFIWMIATALQNELQVQAMTDPLTRALNRRALEITIESAIEQSRRTRQPLSAVVIDLDNFKFINDSMGHHAGDQTLIATVRCIERELRPSDCIARIGGDEFVVILPDCTLADAHEKAERLRSALESHSILIGDHAVHIHASFGVATLSGTTVNWENLLADCDRALYSAKSAGGNLVYVT